MAQGRSTEIISMIKWTRTGRLTTKNSLLTSRLLEQSFMFVCVCVRVCVCMCVCVCVPPLARPIERVEDAQEHSVLVCLPIRLSRYRGTSLMRALPYDPTVGLPLGS